MSFFESLFSGAKAILSGIVTTVVTVVGEVLKEFDRSVFGQAATTLVKGVSKQYFNNAQDLADEEKEYANKRARGGLLREKDLERLREIEAERDALRKELEAAKAANAVKELEFFKVISVCLFCCKNSINANFKDSKLKFKCCCKKP